MKIVTLQSHKGGTGKTTLALLLAKHAAMRKGQKVCIIDCDFIGDGMLKAAKWHRVSTMSLEQWLLDANPHDFPLKKIQSRYSDQEMKKGRRSGFSVVLSRHRGGVTDDVLARIADEPNYREIGVRLPILLHKLEEDGTDLVIFDCSTGLGLLSEAVRKVIGWNKGSVVFVTTPDCGGLVRHLNYLKKDQESKCVLAVNQVTRRQSERIHDWDSFVSWVEINRGGEERKRAEEFLSMFSEDRVSLLAWDEELSRNWGGVPEELPEVEVAKGWCERILAQLYDEDVGESR